MGGGMQVISFVHLSDIHFNRYSGDKYDPDNELRNELLIDISDNCKLENPAGVLVCGDIAFSGQKEEYDFAKEFLNNICDSLQLGHDRVYCVPGNHDINQTIPRNRKTVKLLQDELEKQVSIEMFDYTLANILRSEEDRNCLFSALEEYYKFAAQYYGFIDKDCCNRVFTFRLPEQYSLRIVCMNSTIISNADDHKNPQTERLMVMGRSLLPQRVSNTITLSLCHHPPECWKDDEKQLEGTMNERVHIQLYGHKHIQTIKQAPSGSIIVGSGATHPSRRESGWLPRYNWISIDILKVGTLKQLEVRIFPRVFRKSSGKFESDVSQCDLPLNYKSFILPLPINSLENESVDVIHECDGKDESMDINDDHETQLKAFVYDFFNLSYTKQRDLLTKYDVLDNVPNPLNPMNSISTIICNIEEKHCLSQICNDPIIQL